MFIMVYGAYRLYDLLLVLLLLVLVCWRSCLLLEFWPNCTAFC